ncbi:MAG: metallophosphoesterase [Clostridia bacterium]|nr:metallophosphoesterase [Clostridia bacterium]
MSIFVTGKHAYHFKGKKRIHVILILLLILILLYPFLEPYFLQVDRITVESSSLASDVNRLRIAYVTDFHEGSWPFTTHEKVRQVIRKINSLNPDLILLGGDYAASPDGTSAFFEALVRERFQAPYGVYAVLGEHDRGTESVSDLRAKIMAAGITPLINDVYSIRVGSSNLYIAGLDDPVNGYPSVSQLSGKVRQEDFVIFMCHNPSVIPDVMQSADMNGKRGWVDLGLFGHTHGGQMALFGGLLHLTDGIRKEYTRGLYVENRVPLLISNGIGTSGVPMRLFRFPQIHLITVLSTR